MPGILAQGSAMLDISHTGDENLLANVPNDTQY